MGARGPAPTPLKLKVLNGSAAHDPQRIRKNPARPADRPPKMPAGMARRAQEVWRATLRDQAPGIILAVHAPSLRIYCEAVARYEESAVLLASSGPLIRGARRGDLVRNPVTQVCRDNADLVRLFARELGLTPSSVSSFPDLRVDESDPFEAFLAGRG
ncbi:MAG: P27 family phage terminase small subunit [Acidimicrobiales bacterium]